jgi:hypothetical protein
MGVELDIFGGAIMVVAAIATVVRGARRHDPPKKIRERACFFVLLATIALRGLFPSNSWRVSGIYFAVLLSIALVALWKNPRPKSSAR